MGTFGLVYLTAAVLFGRGAMRARVAPAARDQSANAAVMFHFSLLYLALLFVAVAVDAAVR